jgi:hypothetical protein
VYDHRKDVCVAIQWDTLEEAPADDTASLCHAGGR